MIPLVWFATWLVFISCDDKVMRMVDVDRRILLGEDFLMLFSMPKLRGMASLVLPKD
jgi:hypothetical protein